MESVSSRRATPADRAAEAEREREALRERARKHEQAAARARSRAAARERQAAERASKALQPPTAIQAVELPADRFLDRELSWLQFSQRVLDLTEDPNVPLLERVRFSAIFASGLDEFFGVRIAGRVR